LAKEIALEIVLDWRDFDVFILVTKLENGKLPGGYYKWKGKRYRMYIEKVLKLLSIEGVKEIIDSLKTERKKKEWGIKVMEERIEPYKQLLIKSIGRIVNEGASVIDNYVDPMDRL
jgi:hypothetical protein